MLGPLVRATIVVIVFGTAATSALSQSVVTGTVRDDRGAPLSGAVVQVVGTRVVVSSNEAGRYRLETPKGRADSMTMTARRIGFEPVTRRILLSARDTTLTLDFRLEPAMTGLEEVVVTGTAASRSRAEKLERRSL